MLNLYPPIAAGVTRRIEFGNAEKLSILYHSLFDYPLTMAELVKWKCAAKLPIARYQLLVKQKGEYFFFKNQEIFVYQRILRKKISARKLKIAKKAAKLLSLFPSIKMVAVTGSLAMHNCASESDIDLLIITQKRTLWLTRFLAYCLLYLAGHKLRRSRVSYERDALCLNMWLDEGDLVFRQRNLYTAHEIAQVIPLVNRDKTYEKFLEKNKWILSYWPNAVRIQKLNLKKQKYRSKIKNFYSLIFHFLFLPIERLAFKIQFSYMKSKITREVVTPTRALFHPYDWGKIVLDKLSTSFLK